VPPEPFTCEIQTWHPQKLHLRLLKIDRVKKKSGKNYTPRTHNQKGLQRSAKL
jgi:hypothetical protein